MRPPYETVFAVITLGLTVPYFIGETYHYVAYVGIGNNFLGYFCDLITICLLYTSPSPRDQRGSRMPSSA